METYRDEELVEKALQGDERAFSELYERYHKRLEFVAFRLCKNSEDAKDAVQQTFMQIHTSLYSLRDPSRFYHWCCKIIHGKCTDMFRKRNAVCMDVDHNPLTAVMAEERKEFLPQKQMHFSSDRDVLLFMLDQLPLLQRQVVMLVYFEQLSMQDCAAILNVAEGTVKSRLFTAKKKLREMIKEYNEQNEAPLNFKATALEAFIPMVLMQEGSAYIGSGMLPVPIWKCHFSSCGKALAAAAATLSVAAIGLVITYFYQNSLHPTMTQQAPLQYQERKINNSQEAYFILRNWAVDKVQMENRSVQEITAVATLYEFLKQNDDAYYEVLQQDGWCEAFESLMQ